MSDMPRTAPGAPTASTGRMPALDEEPEMIKFVRTDGVQYEGPWAPEQYDPESAQATLESHIQDVVEAESLGLDGVLLTEHHFDAWTLAPSPNVFLAALAMRTSRLRLGQAVHVLPIHNPWRLAEETGMLDLLSNGRAEVGFGKGNAAPVTTSTGSSHRTPAENLKISLDAAHQAGHHRSGANSMVIVSIIVAPTDAEAKRIQDRAMEIAWDAMMSRSLPLEEAEFYHPVFGGAIIGSPQTVLDQLGPAFEATGARPLNLVWRLRSLPEDVARQSQHLFCTEIMPALRHLPIAAAV